MSLTMGCSYVHGKTDPASFAAILDQAHKNGVQIILCDERTLAYRLKNISEDDFIADLKAVVADWGSHPAIWGVHMGDEPSAEYYPYFIRALHLIREIAPQWEPYANLHPWIPGVEERITRDSWPDYLDGFIRDSGMKYISYDCYFQMRSDPLAWPIYFRNLKLYGDAARRNNIPFWTILLSVPHFAYRDPSLDDIRWQMNTALACGAKGISWFYLYQQDIWHSNYRNTPVNQLGRKRRATTTSATSRTSSAVRWRRCSTGWS